MAESDLYSTILRSLKLAAKAHALREIERGCFLRLEGDPIG